MSNFSVLSQHDEQQLRLGDDPLVSLKALAKRQDTGEVGRFRRHSRRQLADG